MDVRELRIGNYILVESKTEYSISDNGLSIEKANIYHIMDLFSDNKDFSYHPIPLTEEWLLDFGFDRPNLEWEVRHQEYPFTLHLLCTPKKVVNNRYAIHFSKRQIEIKYVHQLQNLYYSLTGEELIKK